MESGTNKITPIFIFSLPRSGSTLLQKIIASSDKVSTASEPWILLPLVYMHKKTGIISEYSHSKANKAFEQISYKLSENSKCYDEYLKEFVLSIYKGLSEEKSIFFLDKTPRYYLIIKEIEKLFPESKFIFLFRNPLSIYSSKLNTRRNNSFKYLYSDNIDLIYGNKLLADGYFEFHNKSIKILYNDLISNKKVVFRKLEQFLGLVLNENILEDLSKVNIKGEMGDPGLLRSENNQINNVSLKKWKLTFNTFLRKKIAVNYLYKLDDNFFECLEVSRDSLVSEVSENKTTFRNNVRYTFKDLYDLIHSWVLATYKPYLLFSSKQKWIKKKYLN
jgi:hypothetical protein